MQSIIDDLIIAYTPREAYSDLDTLLESDNLMWLEQCGADLGERLQTVTQYASSVGYSPIIVVGTDSPTVPGSFIQEAIRSLGTGESDLALGPTEDGGYYVIGLREYVKDLFRDVALSTPVAYEQTRRSAAALNLRLLELPRWFDVDTAADLQRLRLEIFASEEVRAQAPATYEWLKAHQSRLSSIRQPAEQA